MATLALMGLLLLSTMASALTQPRTGFEYFSDTGQDIGTSASWDVALGDIDGDQDLDAITANGQGLVDDEPDAIWINDGQGSFSTTAGLGSSRNIAIVLGDLDGDLDLDLFAGGDFYNEDTVWFNDGSGGFVDSGQRFDNGSTSDVVLGDVDGDDDLDAITAEATWAGGTRVLINDGTGYFTDSGQSFGSGEEAEGLGIGDLDADGDLDLFIAVGTWTTAGRNRVWLNDGSGVFSNSGQSLGSANSSGIALADLDGDGDLDAFVTNYGPDQPNKVWLNDGSGVFAASSQDLGSGTNVDVVLHDIDLDGDYDAIVAKLYEKSEVWLNNGHGEFTLAQLLSSFQNHGLAIGDLDQDGVADLFFANSGSCDFLCQGFPNEVWFGNGLTRVYMPLAIGPSIE